MSILNEIFGPACMQTKIIVCPHPVPSVCPSLPALVTTVNLLQNAVYILLLAFNPMHVQRAKLDYCTLLEAEISKYPCMDAL